MTCGPMHNRRSGDVVPEQCRGNSVCFELGVTTGDPEPPETWHDVVSQKHMHRSNLPWR